MYIHVANNNGKKYLVLEKSVRVENKDGVKVARHKTVLNIGPLSKFDDGKPDYVKRLRKSFKDGEPLIPELKPYCEGEIEAEKYLVTFEEGDEHCFSDPKWCSNIILDRIFDELGLTAFFREIKHSSKIEYDLSGLVKLRQHRTIIAVQMRSQIFRQIV